METQVIEAGAEAGSWMFLEVDENEVVFYRRFVERHGGAFVALREPQGSYRLDFPPGTRIARNAGLGVPLRESYQIVYPDSERLTWYRAMKLDGRVVCNVLMTPVEDDADWARFTNKVDDAAD